MTGSDKSDAVADQHLDGEAAQVVEAARDVVARFPPASSSRVDLMGAWFDAGLAWIHFPLGLGGLGLSRNHQSLANRVLKEAGGPEPRTVNIVGWGICAPTIAEFAPFEQARQWLRPLATGEEIWCQLFSEPGAGSDLAGLATRAVRDGDDWVVSGQKVWNSLAHLARWGILLTRTDPDVPKHRGITYFVVDMHSPGVEVRPLRQLTGQSQFNEVFLSDVRIPDANRLGDVGNGWRVATSTLTNERSNLGDRATVRNSGPIGDALTAWHQRPDLQTAALRDRLIRLWSRAEVSRLNADRARVAAAAGQLGPASSVSKLVNAELTQSVYAFCMDMLGPEATLYGDYDSYDPETDPAPLQRMFLRSRTTTIEGGTSEIVRNVLGERVLGLPSDLKDDRNRPWRDVPRS